MARENQVVGFVQHDDGTQTYTIGGESRTFDPAAASLAVQTRAMYHGFKQRISDKAAMSRDPKTGRAATAEAKRAAVWAIIDHYASGTDAWELPRTGGGGGRSEASYILEALARVQGTTIEVMTARVEEQAEKQRITVDGYLRRVATNTRVAEEIARIRYGTAEGGDDLLAELGDNPDGGGQSD